jgi:hypothetical protein
MVMKTKSRTKKRDQYIMTNLQIGLNENIQQLIIKTIIQLFCHAVNLLATPAPGGHGAVQAAFEEMHATPVPPRPPPPVPPVPTQPPLPPERRKKMYQHEYK